MVTAKGAQGSFSVAVVCAAAAHRLVREAPTCRVVNATTQAAAAWPRCFFHRSSCARSAGRRSTSVLRRPIETIREAVSR